MKERMRLTHLTLSITMTSCISVACGPGEGQGDDPPNDTPFPSGGGGSVESTGGSDAAGSGGATTDEGDGLTSLGRLQILTVFSSGSSTNAQAYFSEIAPPERDGDVASRPCTSTSRGDCSVTVCERLMTEPTDPTPSPSPSVRYHAGTIQIDDAEGEYTATGNPTTETFAYTWGAEGRLLGADTISVDAGGGTISAFSTTVQMPLAPLLLTPSFPDAPPGPILVPVPKTSDFTFTWDARDSAESLQILATYPSGQSTTARLSCDFSVNTGTGTISQELLAQLHSETRIRIFSVNNAVVTTPEGRLSITTGIELADDSRERFPVLVVE